MLAGTTVTISKLADALAAASPWPDGIDAIALAMFAALAFGLPLLGYFFMAVDIRRYLRSLRRALVIVTRYGAANTPYWAIRERRPPCLETLGLELPCTEEQVLAAYRVRVKDLHPDRGGNLQQFLQLQKHFEQALHLARTQTQQAKIRSVSVE